MATKKLSLEDIKFELEARDKKIKKLQAQVKKLKAEVNECHVKLIHM